MIDLQDKTNHLDWYWKRSWLLILKRMDSDVLNDWSMWDGRIIQIDGGNVVNFRYWNEWLGCLFWFFVKWWASCFVWCLEYLLFLVSDRIFCSLLHNKSYFAILFVIYDCFQFGNWWFSLCILLGMILCHFQDTYGLQI